MAHRSSASQQGHVALATPAQVEMKVGSLIATDSYGATYETHIGIVINLQESETHQWIDVLWDNGHIDEQINPDWVRTVSLKTGVAKNQKRDCNP